MPGCARPQFCSVTGTCAALASGMRLAGSRRHPCDVILVVDVGRRPSCATPGILRWYWGRALGRLVDDPILPERLLASQRRHQLVIFTATVGMFLLAVDRVVWLILLLFLGYLAAGYPLRKRLYNETWSVPAYLGFFGRLIVSVYGFWILLLAAPFIQSQVGRADWMTGPRSLASCWRGTNTRQICFGGTCALSRLPIPCWSRASTRSFARHVAWAAHASSSSTCVGAPSRTRWRCRP